MVDYFRSTLVIYYDYWGMNRSVVAHLLKICNFNLSKVN